MHWTYDEVRDLPLAVYALLIEELTQPATGQPAAVEGDPGGVNW